jgi:catechol 2,3-dioxygenase-like lactoylglutathione lyase family enzyme
MKLLSIAVAFVLVASPSFAQAPAPQAGPSPTGLVVGSGNFFSPIVGDLDKAVAFYRDGLGLDVQGAPANADTNPALRNMFGLPDASLRWQIGRPGAMRTGVEIVEITKAGGTALARRVQDPGAFTLIAFVRDLDATLARVKQQGAPIVTRGGVPVSVPFGGQNARMVVVADPAGHFVELVQPDRLPETQAPATANVVSVRVRLTVDDVDKAVRLYRDGLGLQARGDAGFPFRKDAGVLNAFGLAGGEYRLAMLEVPTTGLAFELIEFKGLDRKTVRGSIQDPGSTRIQLQVRDVEGAIAALKQAGGAVVSSGGTLVELPGRGGATTKVAIVREPNNLFLVLLQAAAPAQPAPGSP